MLLCPHCGQRDVGEARFCPNCGTQLGTVRTADATAVRKTVTVVFADIVDSTTLVGKLEPESARHVLDRFHEAMRRTVERNGGTVEKFIGDAVMAVFGIPVLHEDDALRAVRTAVEMRDALARINADLESTLGTTIQMRIGIDTGEVVAGDARLGQAFVTGETVNLAARLESAARPAEILIGESTARLVRGSVETEALGAILLKGRTEPVVAHRLLEVSAYSPARYPRARFVGRKRELEQLAKALQHVRSSRTSRLLTVVGTAGVGKSRLVEEFARGGRAEAAFLRGRCLPYGEGITFWPLKEAIVEAAGLRGDETTGEARARIHALVEQAPDADLVVERVAEAIGIVDAVPEHGGVKWATRRLFEELASETPLVIIFDDVQWAEPTFLDLIEYVARGDATAPLLFLCMARPELLEARLSWGSSDDRAELVFLEPLSEEDSGQLVQNLLGGDGLAGLARERIVDASDGLPLFVESMVALLVENGSLRRENGRWQLADLSRITTPPTVHALIASRLDQLQPSERALLQRGAVEGQVFHLGAVIHLSPASEREGAESGLAELVMKDLIEPASSEFADDRAYRFHHLLVRDVAYQSLQKDLRATLHERFATWVDEQTEGRASEYDEIVGYHLEQAARYETQLMSGAAPRRVAERAGRRLASAGLRSHARGDWSAAKSLLTRALALLPGDDHARSVLAAKRVEAELELAPSDTRLLSYTRCFWTPPFGHRWTVTERAGDLVLRCTSCGREKPHWAMEEGGPPGHRLTGG